MAKLTALTFAVLLVAGVPGVSVASPSHGSENQENNQVRLRTVTLAVENMTCAMCPITVRKSLEVVPGVQSALASDETHTATVIYDPSRASPEDLIRATTEAGYPSSVKQ